MNIHLAHFKYNIIDTVGKIREEEAAVSKYNTHFKGWVALGKAENGRHCSSLDI